MGIVVAGAAVVATGTVVAGTAAMVVATVGPVVATGTGTGEVVELLANVVEEPASSVVVVGITP